MKRTDLFFLFIILFPFSVFSCQKATQSNVTEEISVVAKDKKTPSKADSISILSIDYCSHSGDSVSFNICNDDVIKFFEKGERITDEDVLEIVGNQNYEYFVTGELLLQKDTIPYTILPSGIGFYDVGKLTDNSISVLAYFKGEISLSQNTFQPTKSEVSILSYKKKMFDFDLWEMWKKDDTDDIFSYDSQEYKAYRRWNDKLYTNEICHAFNLCKKVSSYKEIDYLHNVGLYCGVSGYLIKDKRIYYFKMDSGGVFCLFLTNQLGVCDPKIYGCFTSKGLNYFIDYLRSPVD